MTSARSSSVSKLSKKVSVFLWRRISEVTERRVRASRKRWRRETVAVLGRLGAAAPDATDGADDVIIGRGCGATTMFTGAMLHHAMPLPPVRPHVAPPPAPAPVSSSLIAVVIMVVVIVSRRSNWRLEPNGARQLNCSVRWLVARRHWRTQSSAAVD